MSDLIDRQMVSYKLTDLVNEFEEVLSHIRESEENDCVCALCEYDADGAYIGRSGDWCNECPGFDKADCFELNDNYKKEWLEYMNTLPSVQPEVIRCKDCEWWDTESKEKYRVCYNNTSSWKADDYCSYGKLRGN